MKNKRKKNNKNPLFDPGTFVTESVNKNGIRDSKISLIFLHINFIIVIKFSLTNIHIIPDFELV